MKAFTPGVAVRALGDRQYLDIVDGRNERVWILRRHDLQVIGEFGHASHFGGGFTLAHNIGIDSSIASGSFCELSLRIIE